MKQFRYLTLLAVLSLTSQAGAAKIINQGSEFDQFLSATENLTSDKIEAEWERFESKHQFIYDRHVFRKDAPGWEQHRRKKRDLFFRTTSSP